MQSTVPFVEGTDPASYTYAPAPVPSADSVTFGNSTPFVVGNFVAVQVTVTGQFGSSVAMAYAAEPFSPGVGTLLTFDTGTTPVFSPNDLAVGDVANITPGEWTNPVTTITYQWQACLSASVPQSCPDGSWIDGATSPSYTIPPTLSGYYLQAIVTGTANGISWSYLSEARLVAGPPFISDSSTVTGGLSGPTVNCVPAANSTCTANIDFGGGPLPTVSYNWQIGDSTTGPWTTISTTWSATPPSGSYGKYLQLTATATNGNGSPARWTWQAWIDI